MAAQIWQPQASGTSTGLSAVQFLEDGRRGWAVGMDGTILATANGGQSWQPQSSGTSTGLFGGPVPGGRPARLGGRRWMARSSPTANGGQSWQPQASGTSVGLSAVQFLEDGRRGWAVGSNGTILATADGGQSWQPQASGASAGLSAVQFLEDGRRGWAVGVVWHDPRHHGWRAELAAARLLRAGSGPLDLSALGWRVRLPRGGGSLAAARYRATAGERGRPARVRPAARARRSGPARLPADCRRPVALPAQREDRAAAHDRDHRRMGQRQELADEPAARRPGALRFPAGVVQRLAPPEGGASVRGPSEAPCAIRPCRAGGRRRACCFGLRLFRKRTRAHLGWRLLLAAVIGLSLGITFVNWPQISLVLGDWAGNSVRTITDGGQPVDTEVDRPDALARRA